MRESDQDRRRVVVVLGMHRSGTSALMGLLGESGVSLGDDLLDPKIGENDKGFFEHRELVDIHIDLMAEHGMNWKSITPMPRNWVDSPATQTAQQRAVEVIRTHFSRVAVWGMKDPRLCRLLPMWRAPLEQCKVDPLFVFILRDPREVAYSLRRRNGFPYAIGLVQWLIYCVEAWSNLRHDDNVVVVTYRNLLADPEAIVKRVAERLSLPAVKYSGTSIVDPSLRHADQDLHAEIDRALDGNVFFKQACDLHSILENFHGREVGVDEVKNLLVPYQSALSNYFEMAVGLTEVFDFNIINWRPVKLPAFQLKPGERAVLYGTGMAARSSAVAFKRMGIQVQAFVQGRDSAPDRIDGLPVIRIEELAEVEHDKLVVGVSYDREEIRERLAKHGLKHGQNYLFYDEVAIHLDPAELGRLVSAEDA